MEMRVKDSGPGLLFLLPSGHGYHCSLRQPLPASAANTAPNTKLSYSSNSKLSTQNNQLGNFTNPNYSGLLPTQISPETHPRHYLHNQLKSPTCFLLLRLLPKMHKQALNWKGHNCIYANCDHAGDPNQSVEFIISHTLTCRKGCWQMLLQFRAHKGIALTSEDTFNC